MHKIDNNKNPKIFGELEGDENTLENFGAITEENKNQIYPLNEIRIEKKSYTFFELKRQYEERKELQLNPDYQRELVWKTKQKSELIESILMKIPIPVFYFFRTDEGKIQVVDGQQRINAVISFMNNDFSLSPLSIIKDIDGKKFRDLSPSRQRAIEDYSVDVYLIQPPTPEEVMLDIFDRVNRGGTKLNKQEMRNAIYQGKSTKLLKLLSETPSFKKIVGNFIDTQKMKDRYMILRFLGFYLYFSNQLDGVEYKGKLDEFLAEVMKKINRMSENEIQGLSTLLIDTMNFISKHYDSSIFRFYSNSESKRPINMLLFESLTYLFVECKKRNINLSQHKINQLKEEFERSGKFSRGIDGVSNVNYRFKEALKQITGEKND